MRRSRDKKENNDRIYEIREYFRNDGVQITAKTPLDGSQVEYVGHAVGHIKNPANQSSQVPFTFAIEADSIEEAYTQYQEAVNKAWPDVFEKVKAQMQAQNRRIVMARSMDASLMNPPGGNGKALRVVR